VKVTVKERKYPNGTPYWLVRCQPPHGKLIRKFFPDKQSAENYAECLQRESADAMMIPEALKFEAAECADNLRTHNWTIRRATEYVLQNIIPFENKPCIRDLISIYLKEQGARGLAPDTLSEMRHRMKVYGAKFGARHIHELKLDDYSQWMQELALDGYEPQGIRHFLKRAHGFIKWAIPRGYCVGKAMVICIDKATAVRMYDKVKIHWKEYLDSLKQELPGLHGGHSDEAKAKITFMQQTDMAVVVSQSQNEVDDFRKKGLDIATHRARMLKEDLDEKFKDPKDPFRIVFVCAMWMTGFDVPDCSTIYLDKPMRNHTLMQTIARANRVFPQKINGLIVDYVVIFRDLRKALAIYGSGSGGGIKEGDTPVIPKAELIKHLKEAVEEAVEFCDEHGVDLTTIAVAKDFDKVKALDNAVEAIIVNDAAKLEFLALAYRVNQLFKAALPDRAANNFYQTRTLLLVIAEKIRTLTPAADISKVMEKVERLLDDSIATEGYVIAEKNKPVDLSRIDFDALKKQFEKGLKRVEAERLRRLLESKVAIMIRLNKSRMDYMDKLKEMIDEYNAGSINVETFFGRLVEFSRSLQEEDQRAIKEQLTEEELAVFDLLTRPDMKLTKKQEQEVKKVAKALLITLKQEKLVLDWRKRQQSRAAVRQCIEVFLDQLPPAFTPERYRTKCDVIYQHVYDNYFGRDSSVYATVGQPGLN